MQVHRDFRDSSPRRRRAATFRVALFASLVATVGLFQIVAFLSMGHMAMHDAKPFKSCPIVKILGSECTAISDDLSVALHHIAVVLGASSGIPPSAYAAALLAIALSFVAFASWRAGPPVVSESRFRLQPVLRQEILYQGAAGRRRWLARHNKGTALPATA